MSFAIVSYRALFGASELRELHAALRQLQRGGVGPAGRRHAAVTQTRPRRPGSF